MATYREIAAMCLDMMHEYSDDANITEEHIIFLASRYRSFLLKQRYYTDLKKQIPESNYQTICLSVDKTETIDGLPCEGGYMLKTDMKIPTLLPLGTPKLYLASSFYKGEVALISPSRMKYVGFNKWMKSIIYGSLNPDGHVYLTSSNPQFLYLKDVKMQGIFESAEEASKLECGKEGEDKPCDLLDRTFPMEDALIAPLLELVVKALSPTVTAPEDKDNNANDDLNPKA